MRFIKKCHLDEEAFEAHLYNLLSNAVKYSVNGGNNNFAVNSSTEASILFG